MKKIKLFFLFLLAPFYLSAQVEYVQEYDYGSIMPFISDRTAGSIFYLDDTGEHGLVYYTGRKYQAKYIESKKEYAAKLNKKTKKLGMGDLDYSYMDKDILPQPTEEISEKDLKKIYKEIAPKLGNDGEQNMAEIVKFCEEKGISMQNYFPEHYWAKSLGEGWYIPGNKELELIAKLIIGGIGENYHVKDAFALIKRMTELSCGDLFSPFGPNEKGIKSSTMKDAKKGFYSLIAVENSKKGYRKWLELQDEDSSEAIIMAVRKF
ncbi:MAG: hypothetical protein IJE42_07935 [Bacteroidaceae bacterium]|nr:hypothetical protein [Bacteroidaceae bacterium]